MIGNGVRYVLILLVFAGPIFGCDRDTEKEKIQKTLSAVQAAAESKDVGDVLDCLSKAYRDPQGNDYTGIRGLLLYYFFRHQSITIILSGLETEIRGAAADARFQAILSGRTASSGTILPDALGAYRFTVMFAKESGEWKITSAKWDRIGD